MKLKQYLLLVGVLLAAFVSKATEETYSVRKDSTAIVAGENFEIFDGRYNDWLRGDQFKDKSTQLLLKLGIEEDPNFNYINGFTFTGTFKMEKLGTPPLDNVLASKTVDLTISYSPDDDRNEIDLSYDTLNGGHRYRISIESLSGTVPENVYLEAELSIDRFYDLDITTIPAIRARPIFFDLPSNPSNTIPQGGSFPLVADEVVLNWDYVEGAEEYELEWTWVDNYLQAASTLLFNERDFELNNTRIITASTEYRVPMIYGEGFFIYRVRAIGKWTDNNLADTDINRYGAWSSDIVVTLEDEETVINDWPHFFGINKEHEELKNWQYQAVYAEEGKKKEIISYFDGSLRNRQTVTRLNSNNEAIVGESIYDNQGRAAIQILPTPVNQPGLRYYDDLNKNQVGNAYSHLDFDWDNADDSTCTTLVEPMNISSGASKYYSPNNTVENNWQDYVPDAEGFPFVQTEYTPDNTGRIRRQSGVGDEYTIDGSHATQYFYTQPPQEELDRLFGYNVGFNSRYKKNMVVDANGQVSVSYIDPQGRVVATALGGTNTVDLGNTKTNLLSLDDEEDGTLHTDLTTDFLNKRNPNDTDTEEDDNQLLSSGNLGPANDVLNLNSQIIAEDDNTPNNLTYEIKTGVFSDDCMNSTAAYPFIYNLSIDLKDDCGFSVLNDGSIDTLIGGAYVNSDYTGTAGIDYTGGNGPAYLNDFIANLNTGSYTVSKRLTIDADSLEKYADHYIDNLPANCLPDFFENTTDCNDTLPDSLQINDLNLSKCFIAEQMMIADVSPNGQYGSLETGDETTIFEQSEENWMAPYGNTANDYLDAEGNVALINVELSPNANLSALVGTDFTPEITTAGIATITATDGVLSYKVSPKYLAQASDFGDVFEGSWAEALLVYHPEYEYLAICNELADKTSSSAQINGNSISSEMYNNALLLVGSYADASTPANNDLGVNLLNMSGTADILDTDPYYNISNYTHITAFGANGLKNDLLESVLTNYKGQGNLLNYAVRAVMCGTNISVCGLTAGELNNPTTITNITTDQLDQIWALFRSSYLGEKQKIDQFFMDMYAMDNDFYNGYIGAGAAEAPSIAPFAGYPATNVIGPGSPNLLGIFNTVINTSSGGIFKWLSVTANTEFYADKTRRFIPTDNLFDSGKSEAEIVEEIREKADGNVYQETGRCPLSFDVEYLLVGLAQNNALAAGSSIDANGLYTFTPDLYEAMDGVLPSAPYSTPVFVSSDAVSGGIEIKMSNPSTGLNTAGSIILNNPFVGWNWANVEGFEMLYGAGAGNFQILAIYNDGSGIKEEVVSGSTTVEIVDCYNNQDTDPTNDLPDLDCNKKQNLNQDLKNIFAELLGIGTTLPTYTDTPINSVFSSWFTESELYQQIGNPDPSIATLTASNNSIAISAPSTLVELNFAAIPSDLKQITGVSLADASNFTVFYLKSNGTIGEFQASASVFNNTGTVTGFNFECDCDGTTIVECSNGNPYPIIAAGTLSGADCYVDVEYCYLSEICTLRVYKNIPDTIINTSFFLEILHPPGLGYTFDENGNALEVGIQINLLDDQGIVVYEFLYSIPPRIACASTACDDCIPTTVAPQSCNAKFSLYDSFVSTKNTALDPDDTPYPTYAEEDFCETNHAYVTDAYIYYINQMDITTTEDPYYVTISEFANSDLRSGLAPAIINAAIDDYVTYINTNDPDTDAASNVTTREGDFLNWNLWVNRVYITTTDICPPAVLPFYPDTVITFPCDHYTANTDTVNAANQLAIYLAGMRESFVQRYIESATSSVVENFTRTFPDKQYHYTLYYYDQAGNLVETVPPEGVQRLDNADKGALYDSRITERSDIPTSPGPGVLTAHTYQTKYQYNSLNQLRVQSTPDGGISEFGYDELGRLTVSQNAKQKTVNQFSYTKYDEIGRIIEVGEMTITNGNTYGFNSASRFIDIVSGEIIDVSSEIFPYYLNEINAASPVNSGPWQVALEEVTQTIYDDPIMNIPLMFEDYAFDNSRNRITAVLYFENYDQSSSTSNYDNGSFYDYDVHGNVKELVQVNNDPHLVALGQQKKSVKYEYDLVSGNVNEVIYQEDDVDQFVHEYEYDADNRITNVRTSQDKVIYEQDAKYFYYDHGPLARTEIGDKKVQAHDFAYTIQGWLKGVNSENLTALADQGKDANSTGINQMVAKDVCGYSLHYFDDDYNGRFGNDFLAYSETGTPTPNNFNLFNGNIKEMYTASTNTSETDIGTSHTSYRYDQLNRIRSMEQEKLTSGVGPQSQYSSNYTYDRNGNLKTLQREAWNGSSKVLMDNLAYNYRQLPDGSGGFKPSNQLANVDDFANDLPVLTDDLGDQDADNYDYTPIGELFSDDEEEIASIEWKVTGKVQRINRVTGSNKRNLEFVYDGMGNRIMKIVKDNTNGNILDKFYYIRDAQGNCMSIYHLDPTQNDTSLKLNERSIYGSSRVGIELPGYIVASTASNMVDEIKQEQLIGDRRYELANHLGNVLEVIADRKVTISSDNQNVDYYVADVLSQSDYYPFGMLLPNRNDQGNGDYRYSFQGQEKDDEIKGNGNSINYKYRMHDPRVGRFFTTDPLEAEYPHNGPYNFSENRVIDGIELEGLEFTRYIVDKAMNYVNTNMDEGIVKGLTQSALGGFMMADPASMGVSYVENAVTTISNEQSTGMDITESLDPTGLVSTGRDIGRAIDGDKTAVGRLIGTGIMLAAGGKAAKSSPKVPTRKTTAATPKKQTKSNTSKAQNGAEAKPGNQKVENSPPSTESNGGSKKTTTAKSSTTKNSSVTRVLTEWNEYFLEIVIKDPEGTDIHVYARLEKQGTHLEVKLDVLPETVINGTETLQAAHSRLSGQYASQMYGLFRDLKNYAKGKGFESMEIKGKRETGPSTGKTQTTGTINL